MKVLLTGATGFLGGWVARELLAAGHDVRVLLRKTSKTRGIGGLPVERAIGDILDRASVDRALEGRDAVVHSAADVGARIRDREGVYRSNVEGTRTVLEAALAAGVKRAVYTSSVAAVGATRAPVLQTETSPWDLERYGYHYITSKKLAEDAAFEIARRGLPLVAVNPGLILGPGDAHGGSTKAVLEYLRGSFRIYTRGGISFCDVRDVARAHVAALERGRPGERYILAGQNETLGSLLWTLKRISGLARPFRVPTALALSAAFLFEIAAKVRPHSLEEFNRPVVRMGALFNYCDVSKARAELGYEPRPFEETCRDTVRSLLEHGLFPARTPELAALLAAGNAAPEATRLPADAVA